MSDRERSLDDLADAVLDGAAIDWAAIESSAGVDALLVPHLRLVSSIARLHREGVTAKTPPRAADSDLWGHLRLLERVGRGAFGEVYRAWDTRLDREVALKLLPVAQSPDRDAGAIAHEGRLLARVRHPNVVTIHGAERIGDRIGLWMEFVRGRTLEELLRPLTVFTEADVIKVGLELAGAVSAVHRAGLLHRDIKTHNVTRADDGRIVLMDFGAGTDLDNNSSSDVAGTPLYLAPEVLAGKPATVQSDIYSLGVLLYHLLTGSYPIRVRSIEDVRGAHERNERVPLRSSRSDVSQALVRIIERSIDPNPERRYPDGDALARDLAAIARRRGMVRFWYGLGAAAAVFLVVLAVSEVRARLDVTHRSLGSRLVGLIVGTPSIVERRVIAVLPFRILGSEPGSELLVHAITAGLTQRLAIVDGVRVKVSTFVLEAKPKDLADVGEHFGVNLVVAGDARLSRNTLTIHVVLVSIVDKLLLWSDDVNFHFTSEGDLASERNLAGAIEFLTEMIATRLRVKVGQPLPRYDIDLPTLEKFLRARDLRDTPGRIPESIPLFVEVIDRDARYGPAWAALAVAHRRMRRGIDDFAFSPGETARIASLTDRALQIDSTLGEAHASKGYLHALAQRWQAAEASFRRAIQLDPASPVYSDFVLSTLQPWGRLDEALSTVQTALEANPLSLDLRNLMSTIQLCIGLYDEALTNCQRVLDADPDSPFAQENCGRALAAMGRTQDALALFNQRRDANEHWIGYVHAITGRHGEAEALAARNARLPHRQAMIFAGLADKDRAFAALEQVAVVNHILAASYLTYPEFAALRGDPRAAAIRLKLGFPPHPPR